MFHTPNGSDVMSWGFKLQECLRVDIDDNEGVHAMTEDELTALLSQPPSSRNSSTVSFTNSSFDNAHHMAALEDLSAICDSACSLVDGEEASAATRACLDCATDAEDDAEDDAGEPVPCCHNRWDNLRAKKEAVTLRCRECHLQWKTTALRHNKCPYFTKDNCPEGAACTRIHVYRFKLSPKRRKAAAASTQEVLFV